MPLFIDPNCDLYRSMQPLHYYATPNPSTIVQYFQEEKRNNAQPHNFNPVGMKFNYNHQESLSAMRTEQSNISVTGTVINIGGSGVRRTTGNISATKFNLIGEPTTETVRTNEEEKRKFESSDAFWSFMLGEDLIESLKKNPEQKIYLSLAFPMDKEGRIINFASKLRCDELAPYNQNSDEVSNRPNILDSLHAFLGSQGIKMEKANLGMSLNDTADVVASYSYTQSENSDVLLGGVVAGTGGNCGFVDPSNPHTIINSETGLFTGFPANPIDILTCAQEGVPPIAEIFFSGKIMGQIFSNTIKVLNAANKDLKLEEKDYSPAEIFQLAFSQSNNQINTIAWAIVDRAARYQASLFMALKEQYSISKKVIWGAEGSLVSENPEYVSLINRHLSSSNMEVVYNRPFRRSDNKVDHSTAGSFVSMLCDTYDVGKQAKNSESD